MAKTLACTDEEGRRGKQAERMACTKALGQAGAQGLKRGPWGGEGGRTSGRVAGEANGTTEPYRPCKGGFVFPFSKEQWKRLKGGG